MSERWRNLSTKGKIIQATKIVGSALGVAGIVSACTPIDASAPGVDKSTPPPTDTGHVAPPPTEAPAQIDYFANAEDGISTELQNKVDRYLEANDPNGKLEGGFSVVVDDGNDSTSPVEREFAVTTDGNGDLKIIIDNGQGTRALVPDSITNEGSTSQVDPVSGLPIFIYETNPKNSPADFVLNYYPYLDLDQLPNIKQMPIPIHIPNDSLGNLARKVESPALDPEAWNQYGNVLVKNEYTKVYGKQIVVNPEFSGQFGETVFTFCNQVSYLAALADEFSKSGEDSPPAPTGDLKDFETYKASVIQPAINNGQTIEGSHLVAHDKYANKQPGMGMVEPIPNFNPAKCVIKIDGSQQIYPNSLMIDAGSYQIGMDTISLPDGNVVRRLLVNVALTRPKYEVFSANDNTSANENAVAFSQMLNVASANITKIVNEIPSNKSVRDSFVMGPTGGNKSAFSYATTQQAGIDFILEHMANAPAFFIPSTP